MPVGIEIRNDSNLIVIDGVGLNLQMKSRNIIPANSFGVVYQMAGTTMFSSYDVWINATMPVIAVASQTYGVGYYMRKNGANSWIVTFYSNTNQVYDVEWYLFDIATPTAQSGLTIYDPSGTPIFDAAGKSIRVVKSWVIGNAQTSDSFPANGRNLAFTMSNPNIFTDGNLDMYLVVRGGLNGQNVAWSSGTVGTVRARRPHYGPLPTNYASAPTSVLVLDMTNYF